MAWGRTLFKPKLDEGGHCLRCNLTWSGSMDAYIGNQLDLSLEITAKSYRYQYGWYWCEHMTEQATNGGSSMDSVIKKLKDLNLAPDEKLLRKYGIVNEDGSLTNDGVALVTNNAFNDQKAEIVKQLTALDKAEDKSKK